MMLECMFFYMAKQGLLVVAEASKHDSPLTSSVIIYASKEKGQGSLAKEENQLG